MDIILTSIPKQTNTPTGYFTTMKYITHNDIYNNPFTALLFGSSTILVLGTSNQFSGIMA